MWFSVEDPPPDSVLVIVWIAETELFEEGFDLAHWFNGRWYEGPVRVGFFGKLHERAITHWHALPVPPLRKPSGK